MCVSSTLYAVGLGRNLPWCHVVGGLRVGPALRPVLTLSLFHTKPVSELACTICQLSLAFQSSSVDLSEKLLTVKRSICGLAYEPQTQSLSLTIGPPSSSP